MPTIRVTGDRTRAKGRTALILDGARVGEVGRGQSTDVAVDAGPHELWLETGQAESRHWALTLAPDDNVSFLSSMRSKQLFLADPADRRATILPPGDEADRDVGHRQPVLIRDGQTLSVWAHKSGYFRSLDPGANSGSSDAFFVELAYYVLVLPVLGVLRWVRHRFLFRRGWSVGVVRPRRFIWPKKVRLERFRTEAEARARAAALIAELEGRSAP